VLSRQWKNTLYNPILFEHQYKNKLARPINVTFSFPQNEEEAENDECEGDVEMGAFAGVGENPEESENALLLGQTQHHRTHIGIFLINALLPAACGGWLSPFNLVICIVLDSFYISPFLFDALATLCSSVAWREWV